MIYEGTLLSTVMSAVLTPFLGFHAWLLSNNMTTIEYCERRCDRGVPTCYDLGLWENIRSVFGDEWYLWPIPIGGPSGTGLEFSQASLEGERAGDDDEQEGATGSTPRRKS